MVSMVSRHGFTGFCGFLCGYAKSHRHHGPPKKTSRQFAATVSGVSVPPKDARETVAVKCREVSFFGKAMVSEIWRKFDVGLR